MNHVTDEINVWDMNLFEVEVEDIMCMVEERQSKYSNLEKNKIKQKQNRLTNTNSTLLDKTTKKKLKNN